jgi:hypothetical protein
VRGAVPADVAGLQLQVRFPRARIDALTLALITDVSVCACACACSWICTRLAELQSEGSESPCWDIGYCKEREIREQQEKQRREKVRLKHTHTHTHSRISDHGLRRSMVRRKAVVLTGE